MLTNGEKGDKVKDLINERREVAVRNKYLQLLGYKVEYHNGPLVWFSQKALKGRQSESTTYEPTEEELSLYDIFKQVQPRALNPTGRLYYGDLLLKSIVAIEDVGEQETPWMS